MSTKIYNGFRIVKLTNSGALSNLHFINLIANHARHYMIAEASRLATKRLIRQCVDTLDFEAVELSSPKSRKRDDIALEVYMNMLSEENENGSDLDASITLHPVSNGKLLGIIFTENNELLDHWFNFSMPEQQISIEEYHYQDQTDQPEELSEDQWEHRCLEWSEALLDNFNGVPIMNGIGVQLVETKSNMLLNISEVLHHDILNAYIPSFEYRIKTVTKEIMFKRYTSDMELSGNNIFRVMKEFKEYVKTSEGQDEFERISQPVRDTLNPKIKRNDLLQTKT